MKTLMVVISCLTACGIGYATCTQDDLTLSGDLLGAAKSRLLDGTVTEADVKSAELADLEVKYCARNIVKPEEKVGLVTFCQKSNDTANDLMKILTAQYKKGTVELSALTATLARITRIREICSAL